MQNFNQSWKFKRADVSGAEATAFDASSWENVGLPHSFSLPYFMASSFYVGYGWYRKHFSVPSSWTGKNVSLEFQAAFHQGEIYVNGTKVGEHIGGYNGFSIDITSAIRTGDNVVAVRLNNRWNARIPPLTGDHTFQGGLYRNVFVVVTDPLHVTWYGTWVTTPTLATNSGSSASTHEARPMPDRLGRARRWRSPPGLSHFATELAHETSRIFEQIARSVPGMRRCSARVVSAPSAPACAARQYAYERRRPESTTLHQVVRENLLTLYAAVEKGFASALHAFVRDELEAMSRAECFRETLRCLLVRAVSGESWLPSVAAGEGSVLRARAGAWPKAPPTGSTILPKQVPLRQFVLTVPFELRAALAYDSQLLDGVGRIVVDTVLGWYRRMLAERGVAGGQNGSITAIQRLQRWSRAAPRFAEHVLL